MDQNEAKLKCLRWIEAMTMASPELFSQELGEHWFDNDSCADEDEGENLICLESLKADGLFRSGYVTK